MKKRTARLTRETNETSVSVALALDGTGTRAITTGIGFLDHMLDLFGKQGLFDLEVRVPKADLDIDEHHTAEDVAITLGQTFDRALGDRRGITRYGFFILPMDEALVEVVIDLGGRPWFELRDREAKPYQFRAKRVGDLPTELVYDILQSFTANLKANLHITVRSGRNAHHVIEAIFKCLARALRMACEIDPRAADQIPSTKGTITSPIL